MPRRSLVAALLSSVAPLVFAVAASAQYPPGPPTIIEPLIPGPSIVVGATLPIATTTIAGAPTTLADRAPSPTTAPNAGRPTSPTLSNTRESTSTPAQGNSAAPPASLVPVAAPKADSTAPCRILRIDANQFAPNSDVTVRIGGRVIGQKADANGNVVAMVPGVCDMADGTSAKVGGVDKNRHPRNKTVKVKGDLILIRLNGSAFTGSNLAIPLTADAVATIVGGIFMLVAARRRDRDDEGARRPRAAADGSA